MSFLAKVCKDILANLSFYLFLFSSVFPLISSKFLGLQPQPFKILYCNPFGRPASPKRRMRDPGKEFVNYIDCFFVSSAGRPRLFLRLFVSCFVRSFDSSCGSSFVPLVRSSVRPSGRLFISSFVCSFV